MTTVIIIKSNKSGHAGVAVGLIVVVDIAIRVDVVCVVRVVLRAEPDVVAGGSIERLTDGST